MDSVLRRVLVRDSESFSAGVNSFFVGYIGVQGG